MTSLRNLNSVDAAKYIMALAVVAIHIEALYKSGEPDVIYPSLLEWFIRLAVPFFFITTGWLIHRKLTSLTPQEKAYYLKHKLYTIIKIWGLWLLIYLPIAVIHFVNQNDTIIHGISSYIFNVVTKGESYFAWPLWYLYALAFGIAALLLSYKKLSFQIICGLLFLIPYLISNGFILSSLNSSDTGYSLIYTISKKPLGGGIYIISGWFLYNCYKFKSLFTKSFSITSTALSLILYYLDLPLWQIMGGLGIFSICLCIKLKTIKTFYSKLRSESMWIYFSHMILLYFINETLVPRQMNIYFVLTIASTGCIFLGTILYRLSKRFPFINCLVS